jgi:hypothetical protein
MSKESNYVKAEKESASDSMDSLNSRLAADLRRSIRGIGSYKLFSPSWLDMCETYGRLAVISNVESSLSAGKSNDGTLWETEEQALRFILEDGKLNICLRNMMEYKDYQQRYRSRDRISDGDVLEEMSPEVAIKCESFEKGLGSVLYNCWNHVEALQTTDVASLLNYISTILSNAIDNTTMLESLMATADFHQYQEVMCFYYIYIIFKHIEDIKESRIMPVYKEKKIFMKQIELLNIIHSRINAVHVLKAVEGLSFVCETDDFSTYFTEAYVTNSSEAAELLALKNNCLNNLYKEFDNRKYMRALIDTIDKAKRKYKL